MKPDLTLSELEREPIVYFGCTWSEIKTCIWRGAAVALPVTLGLMMLGPLPVLMLVPGLLLWVGAAYGFTQYIHRHRAGKPLFYEMHRTRVKAVGAPFIRPGQIYQVERHPRSRGATRTRRT